MFKSRLRRIATATIALVLVAGLASAPALAADAKWTRVEVRMIYGQSETGVLVAGQLDPSTPLPATVKLTAPKGTQLAWAGEILGGNVQDDPTVQYTTTSKGRYDEVAFTLTKARRGQIEYADPSAVTTSGSTKTAKVTWTSPAAVPEVILAVEVPQDAKVASDGGAQRADLQGSIFYTKQFKSVKAGQTLKLAVKYTGGTVTPSGSSVSPPQPGQPLQPTPTTGSGPSLPLMILVLAAVLGGAYLALKRVAASDAEEEPAQESRPVRAAKSEDDFDAFGDDEADTAPSAPPKPKAKPKARTPKSESPGSAKTAGTSATERSAARGSSASGSGGKAKSGTAKGGAGTGRKAASEPSSSGEGRERKARGGDKKSTDETGGTKARRKAQ